MVIKVEVSELNPKIASNMVKITRDGKLIEQMEDDCMYLLSTAGYLKFIGDVKVKPLFNIQ